MYLQQSLLQLPTRLPDDSDASSPVMLTKRLILVLIASVVFANVGAFSGTDASTLPLSLASQPTPAPPRSVTTNDLVTVRQIQRLELAPNKRQFAIFVRQPDPLTNRHIGSWYIGDADRGTLVFVGDAGDLHLSAGGWVEPPLVQWSPDGLSITYTRSVRGEVQLWRSSVTGALQEQLTHAMGDVQDFAWSESGHVLYYKAGTPRTELREQDQRREREGYPYDDLSSFTDLLLPRSSRRAMSTPTSLWILNVRRRVERLATEHEQRSFERERERSRRGITTLDSAIHNAPVSPLTGDDGARVWLERSRPYSEYMHLVAYLPASDKTVRCIASECFGSIHRVWWTRDGKRVLFWRSDGLGKGVYGGRGGRGFYTWSPDTGAMSTILYTMDDFLGKCDQILRDRILCVRQTPTRPPHLVTVDLRSGTIRDLVDVNPEFRSIRLGRAERIEWDTPTFEWNETGGELEGYFPSRTYGYILYPPDFDPQKKYPVFIEPYVAYDFINEGQLEQPLHAYAANGFVVINAQFPLATESATLAGSELWARIYSTRLGLPLLSVFSESTLRVLDEVIKRGFVDNRRVGIGGVSHGTFVPLYMLQKYDRIAAISISGPNWEPIGSNYLTTRKSRAAIVGLPDAEGPGREFWRQVDIADHIESIEAPVLMNLPASETAGLARLIRRMSDAGKPYDAYVFPEETHIKWQPAHLLAIQNRNLDWFRFWLQDYEDPNPTKHDQYLRWRQLRSQHDANQSADLLRPSDY